MKQRLACLVLVELRDLIGRPSVETTAAILCSTGILAASFDHAVKTTSTMIDAGHRYINMEKNIARGLALVVGTNLREYCWIKYKSGPVFDAIKTRLQQDDIAALALTYHYLQERITRAEIDRLYQSFVAQDTAWPQTEMLLSPLPLFHEGARDLFG
ncbi:hypothetical protein BAUCODRAFT_444734 [Baudoinia panamericana UAMH 10762]|uniref:Uncharacterized protein n=1 Tax=Baudoinia panamericana (strain UAMH 10762) TaxID=717646 RepID=M2NDD9_BAUPA|nr:uncharacterized protein BAUCODRAFT_444734 [Baudoinia panamericana UAMH 10762]EMC97239.1 hypothetical protein BAUCODRAFT_444734 [Baudoinia panamericana UAMH 10762]